MSESAPIVVFAGPSIHRKKALEILGPDGIVLPPAAAGDLIRSLRLNPRSIVLLDGRFDDVPSPWHKEILIALEHGVHVFGGASMGALRAIECEPFGAAAIGEVADSYRRGRLEDDAVAIAHLPAAGGWAAVSTALVDIEAVVEAGTREGTISGERGQDLIRQARETPFPERKLPLDLRDVTHGPGLKERDAILACRKAAETTTRRPRGNRVPRTTWLLRLARIALGSAFPECEELPDVERRFSDIVAGNPWIAPLLSDAITFSMVRTPVERPSLSATRRDALREHHISRVSTSGPLMETGKNLALRIADRQTAIIESLEGLEVGEGARRLLGLGEDDATRDDALARLIRSEGVPPVRDDILDVSIEDLAGIIEEHVRLSLGDTSRPEY